MMTLLVTSYLGLGVLIQVLSWFLVPRRGPLLWEILSIPLWPLAIVSGIFSWRRF
jgi:hypothetical protein